MNSNLCISSDQHKVSSAAMETFNVKCRKKFCFIIAASFGFWALLFYFCSYTEYPLLESKNNVQSVPEMYPNSVLRSPELQRQISPLPVVIESDAGQPVLSKQPVEEKAEPDSIPLHLDEENMTVNNVQSVPEQYPNSVLRSPEMQRQISPLPVIESDARQPVLSKQPVEEKAEPDSIPLHLDEENMTVIDPDPCSGKYIYVHDLPTRFNDDILKDCKSLNLWMDMCPFISNMGLGPELSNEEGTFSNVGWYATNQFSLEVIFYNRMKQYKCLTSNSSVASAIFVPFFTGLDVSRYLWGGFNTTTRDNASLELVKWLVKRPEWRVLGGRDHFLVGGRITWDFRRQIENGIDWGNKLLHLPEVQNMTMLIIESSPWSSYDFGIPYPTYFHPSKDIEVFQWQNRMRRQKRYWWFSFAGATRPNIKKSIRGQIIEQCQASNRCKLLECRLDVNQCHSPTGLMKMFQRSIFCLQPQGDSYTRRSAFDSILAGCIPVFFHPASAYVQYTWHLPLNHSSYSVFIPEDDVRDGKVSIENILLNIPKERVRAMREKVIELIPRIIYADPRYRLETLEDAFDIAVQGVIQRVSRLRKETKEGRNDLGFTEGNNWKYALIGNEGEHEWDRFLTEPKDAGKKDRRRPI